MINIEPPTYQKATLLSRRQGFLYDAVFALLLSFCFSAILAIIGALIYGIGSGIGVSMTLFFGPFYLFFPTLLFYYVFYELIINKISKGKKKFDLSIVSKNGGNPSFLQRFFRILLKTSIFLLPPFVIFTNTFLSPYKKLIPSLLLNFSTCLFIIFFFQILFILFFKNKILFHDFLSGTLVVRNNKQDSKFESTSIEEKNNYNTGKPADLIIRVGALTVDYIIYILTLSLLNILTPPILPITADIKSLYLLTNFYGIIAKLLIFYYFVYFESSKEYQGSIGKNIFKLKITDQSGNNISVNKAISRNVLKILSLPLFFLIIIRKDKRGLHDIICNTYVVRK